MESEEEFANDFLVIDDLGVDRFDDDCEHCWVLETEVFEFYFSLREGKQFLVVVDSLTWVSCLFDCRRSRGSHA